MDRPVAIGVDQREAHDRRPAVIVQPEPLFRAAGPGPGRVPREAYPPDIGLAAGESGGTFHKMGLFETAEGLTAVPINLLSQVVPMRPTVGVPAFGDLWEGIFFERGLCHGLLRVGGGNGNGGGGNGGPGDGPGKIAILRFPERCGVGVSAVIGEIDVPLEKLETVPREEPAGPVRLAARFDLDGESVRVLDVARAAAEETD